MPDLSGLLLICAHCECEWLAELCPERLLIASYVARVCPRCHSHLAIYERG